MTTKSLKSSKCKLSSFEINSLATFLTENPTPFPSDKLTRKEYTTQVEDIYNQFLTIIFQKKIEITSKYLKCQHCYQSFNCSPQYKNDEEDEKPRLVRSSKTLKKVPIPCKKCKSISHFSHKTYSKSKGTVSKYKCNKCKITYDNSSEKINVESIIILVLVYQF
ncbi:hypothetical protein ACTFIZ_000296 [Dictyostelium cf. discoideum]